MPPKRKYDDDYIKLGFTSIEINGETRPQCVLCATVLSNDALKPAKLERHLKTVHPKFCNRSREFLEGKLTSLKKMKLGPSGTSYETSEKTLSASFEVSKLIAKSKKAHTIGESLIKPCMLKVAEELLGAEAQKKIREIPLSNDTIKSRIQKMSTDIEDQVIDKIKNSPYFALQCDESTDVSQCCQLLVFIRFLEDNKMFKEELLFSQELKTTSQGADVMNAISQYMEEHGLMWERLAGFCTDGAPAMLGSRSGLAALVKTKNPSAITTHCVIHRQALAAKTLPECFTIALKTAIKVVNFIKKSALNTRLFKQLCSDMNSEHETLLFHTEVRWLSKGNMLSRLYELREEVQVFLTNKENKELLDQFCEPEYKVRFAYLVDFFAQINKLNLQMQGSGNLKLQGMSNIFAYEDKIRAFIAKIELWINKIERKNFSAFDTLNQIIDGQGADIKEEIQKNVMLHLTNLKSEFNRYFPDCEDKSIQKLIRNPFIVNVSEVSDEIQEEVIEMQHDTNLKDTFESGINLEDYWSQKAISFPKLRDIAIRYLTLFSSTYLCEQGFSTLLIIKNKHRNRLDATADMRLALSSTEPRIPKLVKSMQVQKSH
ncbi:SCAN domain-containing protein 3-like [Vanessa cardui]|uniref:SCAN domain-containing protein 3-like n=1 Tax=Vanessa cardui TaxID=171605 RepID=UPI001F12B452|nr:SCAN domain-containing protein 3-like [Vanessa cardui]